MSAAEALLAHAIDYAGMFPPAGLDLPTTVRNYEAYRAGRDAWALGRLILPASAVAEFVERWPLSAAEWPISLLLSGDFAADVRNAARLGMLLDVVECRPARVEQVGELRRLLPDAAIYIELPGAGMDDWLAAIADVKACAKIRTGGVTAEAIPQTAAVTEFLVVCAKHGLMLKATAGLHHAIRAEHSLTYDPQSARAIMHGFVNFFIAAAVAYDRESMAEAEAVLVDDFHTNFRVDEERLWWRERSFSAEQVRAVREKFAVSFGSCSFTEPLEDMRTMGWIG